MLFTSSSGGMPDRERAQPDALAPDLLVALGRAASRRRSAGAGSGAASAARGAARPCASTCPSAWYSSSVHAPTMWPSASLPHLARLVGVDVEALELGARRRAAGAEVDPAVGDEVEHRDRLGGADRVVVRLRQQTHAVPDADVLGARGDRAVEHLGVRAVRVLLEEVVLDGPERVEAHLVAEDRLLDRVLVRLVLLARRPRARDRDLVEQRELHARPPGRTCLEPNVFQVERWDGLDDGDCADHGRGVGARRGHGRASREGARSPGSTRTSPSGGDRRRRSTSPARASTSPTSPTRPRWRGDRRGRVDARAPRRRGELRRRRRRRPGAHGGASRSGPRHRASTSPARSSCASTRCAP